MNTDADVCVIGSGAGGGPVAYSLTKAGYSVIVLEKGPWFNDEDFSKDELCAIKGAYKSHPTQEPHVVEVEDNANGWSRQTTRDSHWNLWNGNCIGGSSNFMSGYFYRYKPMDFRLKSEFGPIPDANIVDWPISYDDLEPYYTKIESLVGISGAIKTHKFSEPRSASDFPFPPLAHHPVASWVDQSCKNLGVSSYPIPRAILSKNLGHRKSCSYTGYCGSYGCSTGAKGSSRVTLLNDALATGNCKIVAHAHVTRLHSDSKGKVTQAEYVNQQGISRKISASNFIVACQSIETARLLLLSPGPKHPNGLGNNHNLVGKNLLFAGGAAVSGKFLLDTLTPEKQNQLKTQGPFINRGTQHWYVIDDKSFGPRMKGGTLDFVLPSPSPITKAHQKIYGSKGLIWGDQLNQRLEDEFLDSRTIEIEAFCDWLPHSNCFIELDQKVRDYRKNPVAKVRTGFHLHNLTVGWYLGQKGAEILKNMGAKNVMAIPSSNPPTNLVAGGCRFGKDPKHAVLDSDCRVFDAPNLYVTDGSFLPNGGSVPYTWTIYANSLRVADIIKSSI